MRVNPIFVPVIMIVALLGTVFVAQAAGIWSTSGRTTTLTTITPADIKGWMTLQQVIDGLGIPQDELYALGNIPSDIPPTAALKDLESLVPGFETSTLRDALTARFSTPANTSSPTAEIPPNTATPAQPVPTATVAAHVESGIGPTPLPSGQILPASQIKGSMTLRQVSERCGVALDALLTMLDLPSDTDTNSAIKNLVAEGKLTEVTVVQDAVASLQK